MFRDARCRESLALDYALDRMSECAPVQTRRARGALDVLLRGVRTSPWPEVAWAFSQLTPDGFPVELTFSSEPGNTVRYALEVAGPEMPEHQRVREAFRLYQTLAGHPASSDVEQSMLEMQTDQELFYGAWFGGAHGTDSDRYKIYAEVPKSAFLETLSKDRLGRLVPCDLTQGPLLTHCRSFPVMLGFQPDTGVRELYFRAAGLAAEDLGRLLWNNGLAHRYQETLELMRATCGRPGAIAAIQGFSLAGDAAHTVKAISLFTDAYVVFGPDAHARRTLLQVARLQNWPLELYEQATRPLQDREDLLRHQGVIAWIVSDQGPIEVRIGLRPPEPPVHPPALA